MNKEKSLTKMQSVVIVIIVLVVVVIAVAVLRSANSTGEAFRTRGWQQSSSSGHLTCQEVKSLELGQTINVNTPQGGPSVSLTLLTLSSNKLELEVDGTLIEPLELGSERRVASYRLSLRPIHIDYQAHAGGLKQTTLCLN